MLSFLSGLTNFQHYSFEADLSQLLIYLSIMKSSFPQVRKYHNDHILLFICYWHTNRAMQRSAGFFNQKINKSISFWTWSNKCFGSVVFLTILAASSVLKHFLESRMTWKAKHICMCFHILVGEIVSGSMTSQLWCEVDQSDDLLQSKKDNDLEASVELAVSWIKWEMHFEIPADKGEEKCSKQESNHLAPRNN